MRSSITGSGSSTATTRSIISGRRCIGRECRRFAIRLSSSNARLGSECSRCRTLSAFLILICPLIDRFSAGGGHAVVGWSRNRLLRAPCLLTVLCQLQVIFSCDSPVSNDYEKREDNEFMETIKKIINDVNFFNLSAKDKKQIDDKEGQRKCPAINCSK